MVSADHFEIKQNTLGRCSVNVGAKTLIKIRDSDLYLCNTSRHINPPLPCHQITSQYNTCKISLEDYITFYNLGFVMQNTCMIKIKIHQTGFFLLNYLFAITYFVFFKVISPVNVVKGLLCTVALL